MPDWLITIGDAARMSVGFFWKAGWAFVLGYGISAMIQTFVPRARLSRYLGRPSIRSIGLATAFGAISSSCSFAALAAARALVHKGAHFVAAIAFMFASTNLVIELGILILIFLGWQFLVAEIIGGVMLIIISSILLLLTFPKAWREAAREKVQTEGDDEDEDFDWLARLRSRDGWRRVGRQFGAEWKMVWQEITVGFTIAGVMAAAVPESFWRALFLAERAEANPGDWLVIVQNALVAPFVAAATFIGSMGNIPLATVLASGGVLFAGIMGFIYSDLMVPPLIKVNAKYYGWRVALYIAGVMYISIVLTALILHGGFAFFDVLPEPARKIEEITQFAVDYTLVLNVVAAGVVGLMVWLARRGARAGDDRDGDHGSGGVGAQMIITIACIVFIAGGLIIDIVAKAG